MPISLGEMAQKGQTKLAAKAGSMAASWNAAKGRMAAGYSACPFGPTRTANFQAGINAATYRAPDPAKWAQNWQAKMSE